MNTDCRNRPFTFHDLINRAVGIQGYRAFEIDHDLREALQEAYQGASLPVSVDPEKSDMGERKVAFCLAPVAGNGSHFVAVVWDQMLPCHRPVIQFSTNSSSWATRRGQ